MRIIFFVYYGFWNSYLFQTFFLCLIYPPLNPLPRGDFFIPLHGGAALFPSWEGTGVGLIAFTPIQTIQYKF